MQPKLILWDIDGTLLNTSGISGDCMRAAMEKVFQPFVRQKRPFYSGKTDRQIILDTFPDVTLDRLLADLPRFTTTYIAEVERRKDDLINQTRIFPGVRELLTALQGRVIQAPLTGNIAPVAQRKLDWVGLLSYFHFEIGAYGDDHQDRSQLVAFAAERAAAHYGRPFTGTDIVIVGDTPHDIACGRQNHARSVAVATGPYSLEELREHQPDAVLSDLHDLPAALHAILPDVGV